MLSLRCVYLGELPGSLSGAGSVGAVFPVRPLFPGGPAPSQAQGDIRRNKHTGGGQLSSPRVRSSSNSHSSQSAGAWMLRGGGANLHSLGVPRRQERPRCPLSSRPPPVPGGVQDPGLCTPCALGSGFCAAGIALPGLPPLEPIPHSCSRGPPPAAPALYHAWPPGCAALYPGRTFSVSDPGNLGSPLPLLQYCPGSPLSASLSGKNPVGTFKVPAS